MTKPSYRLWTPIANALDAYRRRVVADADAVYEHTWRLIHIHESLIVTLGALLATRLLQLWSDGPPDDLDRLRHRITGLAAPVLQGQAATDLPHGEGCLDGFVQPWVNLLKEFGLRDDLPQCAFCTDVHNYLGEMPTDRLAFLDSWKNIADVPRIFTDPISRVDRFAAINSLRNKLAHVPVPYPVIEPLHRGLRTEVLSLLSPVRPEDGDDVDVHNKWHAPLSGRLLARGVALFGAKDFAADATAPQDNGGSVLAQVEAAPDGSWGVVPFVRVDEELKVSLLLLLNGLRDDSTGQEFSGEYHRFAAEFRPIQVVLVASASLRSLMPRSAPAAPPEQGQGEAGLALVSQPVSALTAAQQLRAEADTAFRLRDFQRALTLYDQLALLGDTKAYNDVAKSKHGGALWRVAELTETPDRRARMDRAIDLLTDALSHRDPAYRARTLYERSKARWHRWRLDYGDESLLRDAVMDATHAAAMENAPSFISWYERLTADLEQRKSAPPQTGDGPTRG
jgi:hypothetical protein